MQKIIKFIERRDKCYKRRNDSMCTILKDIRHLTPHELLNKYDIDDSVIPVDIALLMEKIGISTIARDFTDLENKSGISCGSILGVTISNGEKIAIFYKKSSSFHRKKFTIAHELAHCCLHCPTDETSHTELRIEPFSCVKMTEEEIQKEREANIFAGKLLIPQKALNENYNQLVIPSLKTLSKIFDVSASVMAARLDHLNLPYYKDTKIEMIL